MIGECGNIATLSMVGPEVWSWGSTTKTDCFTRWTTVELISYEKKIRALPEEYRQNSYLVLQMDLPRVIMKELEFKQRCYLPSFAFGFERLSYDLQTRKKPLSKTVLRSPSGSHDKQVDINYLVHIPQNRSIVRITSILKSYKVIVCFKDKINVSPSCDTAQAQRRVYPRPPRCNGWPRPKLNVNSSNRKRKSNAKS
uniref:(northern house mosquito) hypothetical protein n=1 Tax=Culex pipiens TaxID=7175 RepID=A0A8D8F258_CULPI